MAARLREGTSKRRGSRLRRRHEEESQPATGAMRNFVAGLGRLPPLDDCDKTRPRRVENTRPGCEPRSPNVEWDSSIWKRRDRCVIRKVQESYSALLACSQEKGIVVNSMQVKVYRSYKERIARHSASITYERKISQRPEITTAGPQVRKARTRRPRSRCMLARAKYHIESQFDIPFSKQGIVRRLSRKNGRLGHEVNFHEENKVKDEDVP
ncbi:hypothetical protein SCHPADRAFT_896902 [Schizopora paradoxa]|uniref:Uncharacterized protein n=1 Tax=Schizopora paradoxa TaxID=27342 RepID=A0A0H2RIC6_9AGAM|nr:hypothetical protein SCHPADRAFT_896902 [Schizopora paradoxa]